MSRFAKGHQKAGGRKKGTPNRDASEFKQALEDAGFDIAQEAIKLYRKRSLDRRPELRLRILSLLAEYSQTKPQAPEPDRDNGRERPLKDLSIEDLKKLAIAAYRVSDPPQLSGAGEA